MDLGLKDKVIFIAGASRGIGHGIAESLLKEGARVALTARGAEALEATRAAFAAEYGAGSVWSFAADLTQSAGINAAVAACEAEFGPLSGAVANVGLSPSPLGIDVSDEDWDAGLDQNLNSAFRLARAAIPRISANGGGSFLFISSIAGLGALGTPLIYGATKAAVNHLSTSIARFADDTKVRVNTIAPGNIIFPGSTWEKQSTGPRAEAWWRWIRREVPMKRFGTPQEIGDTAAFLLSERASFINGAVIAVDGGQTR
ncbi:SDR family NAD(P)-dependent oxidoreductase [Hyphomonas sp.]|uniref:SDR family NAD(P)-dependent oxidoreductase n=1 Tax=Hyphomonas sp. TaxID=87 RepID=UPI00391D1B07